MFKNAQTYTYMPLQELTNTREHTHSQTLKCKHIHPYMNVHTQTHMEELKLHTHKHTSEFTCTHIKVNMHLYIHV